MWKRNLAAAVLSGSGASNLAAHWQFRHTAPVLRVLAYHRILPAEATVWDDGVVDATAHGFRRQMQFIKRYFTVISFRDLAACLDSGDSLPPNPMILTFDDGYRDNFTVAFPILAELGLPATIFLFTGYIGRDTPFWWDQVAYCIKKTNRKCVQGVTGEAYSLTTPDERLRAVESILRSLKAVPNSQKDAYIARLCDDLEAHWSSADTDGLIMTWDDVREMSRHGIEFGGHTITHPVLTQILGQEAWEEITGCKRQIEEATEQPVIAFAYPVGGAMRFDAEVRKMVARAGYRFAVSYMRGINTWPLSDRFAIRRFAVDSEDSFEVFRAKLTLPGVVRY